MAAPIGPARLHSTGMDEPSEGRVDTVLAVGVDPAVTLATSGQLTAAGQGRLTYRDCRMPPLRLAVE